VIDVKTLRQDFKVEKLRRKFLREFDLVLVDSRIKIAKLQKFFSSEVSTKS